MSTEHKIKDELEIDEDEIMDFLTEDNALPGQKYGCVSFISPEKEIAQKNDYFAYNFYKYQMKMVKNIIKHQFNDLKKKNELGNLIDITDVDKMGKSLIDNLDRMDLANIVNRYLYEEVKDKKDGATSISEEKADYSDFTEFADKYLEEFENYKVGNDDRIQSEYDNAVEFKTNIRGIKLRGNFDTLKEARMRAKLLQKRDPSFHVWVAQVGFWVPWDADPDKAPSSEYQEEELQKLAEKKKENEEKREILQAQRREDEQKLAKLRNKKAKADQLKKLENDKLNNKLNKDTESNDVEIKPPTERLSFEEIEALLTQRKQDNNSKPIELSDDNIDIEEETETNLEEDTETNLETKLESNPVFDNKLSVSDEIAKAGLGGMDPWLSRKISQQIDDDDDEE